MIGRARSIAVDGDAQRTGEFDSVDRSQDLDQSVEILRTQKLDEPIIGCQLLGRPGKQGGINAANEG